MTSTVTIPTWLFVILALLALWALLERLLVPGVRWYLRRKVERIGAQVMDAIARNVPVLPVSLVATVFLRSHDAGWSELELKSAAYDLILRLEKAGAHIYVPRGDLDYAIGVGLRMLLLRRIVVEQDGLYRANPAEAALLSYYANAIEPLVAAAGGPQAAPPEARAA